MSTPDVLAAGAVCLRRGRVLLVHRPRYDDWSFPKGKLDRGETSHAAAVREVAEETGLSIRLGVRLSDQGYQLSNGRHKVVAYWRGFTTGRAEFVPNNEVDEIRWVKLAKAPRLLSYDYDRDTLAQAVRTGKKTRPLIIVRHSHARSRRLWHDDDRIRPLLKEGQREAVKLAPVLAAFGPTRLISSPSVRCVQTLSPYVDLSGLALEAEPVLSEEEVDEAAIADLVRRLMKGTDRAILCSHRPVLPTILDTVGVDRVKLPPSGMVVVHHRDGKVRGTEII